MHRLKDATVIVVEPVQLFQISRIRLFQLWHLEGIDAVRIDSKQSHRPEVFRIHHTDRRLRSQAIAKRFGHGHEMTQQRSQSGLAQQLQRTHRRHRPTARATGFQRVAARVVIARLEQIRSRRLITRQHPQIFSLLHKKRTGYVRRETGLVIIHSDGIRQIQMSNATIGSRQCSQGSIGKLQFVLCKVIVTKHTPRPADNCVGVQMRHVVQRELADKIVTDLPNLFQVIEPKRIGRSHGRHDAGDAASFLQQSTQFALQQTGSNFIIRRGRNRDHVAMAKAQP